MGIEAVIFDMDGLLVDSEPLSQRAWARLAAVYGFVLDEATYGRMVGRRSDEAARLFLQACPLPLAVDAVVAQKGAYLEEIKAQEVVPVMAGVAEVVTAVGHHKLPYAVATSSKRSHAEQIMAQLGLTPVAIAGGDEVTEGKPAPDIYLLAAARLGLDPAGCLALEDSLPGCEAARAAGMRVVAVPNGVTHQADFSQVTGHVYDSLHGVAADLTRLLA